jgi:hypothetical protein
MFKMTVAGKEVSKMSAIIHFDDLIYRLLSKTPKIRIYKITFHGGEDTFRGF